MLGGSERLGVEAFAKVSVSQIVFQVVGIGIGTQRRLEMHDGIVVQTETGKQYAHSRLRAIIAGAELVELRDSIASFIGLAHFQIGFGEKIEILGLVGMLFDLLGELR